MAKQSHPPVQSPVAPEAGIARSASATDWAELYYHPTEGWLEGEEWASDTTIASDLKQRFEAAWEDVGADRRQHPAGRTLRINALIDKRGLIPGGLDAALAEAVAAVAVQGRAQRHLAARPGFLLRICLTADPRGGSVRASPVPEVTDPSTAEEFLQVFTGHAGRIEQVLDPVLRAFRTDLSRLEGKSFGPDVNRRIIETINETMNRLRVAVACPVERCDLPAKLRFDQPGRSTSGIIQYQHYTPSQTGGRGTQHKHGGAPRFGRLRLIWADGTPIPD